MSLKKLELKYKKQFELIESLSRLAPKDSDLINASLKLSNEFHEVIKNIKRSRALKKDSEWVKARESGKAQRKTLSDSIKTFIEYAKTQGSKGADKYYVNFTKMQNLSLLNDNQRLPKVGSFKDNADLFQLNALSMSDMIISVCIKEGIEKGIAYKEIYKQCKQKVSDFAKSIGI